MTKDQGMGIVSLAFAIIWTITEATHAHFIAPEALLVAAFFGLGTYLLIHE